MSDLTPPMPADAKVVTVKGWVVVSRADVTRRLSSFSTSEYAALAEGCKDISGALLYAEDVVLVPATLAYEVPNAG